MTSRSREEAAEYVLKTSKEHDVKFIRLWFTDILGMLKSFAITVEELEGALQEGMGFDGSSIEGFARIDESDMVAMPDPDTFQLLPWRPREHRADLCIVGEVAEAGAGGAKCDGVDLRARQRRRSEGQKLLQGRLLPLGKYTTSHPSLFMMMRRRC